MKARRSACSLSMIGGRPLRGGAARRGYCGRACVVLSFIFMRLSGLVACERWMCPSGVMWEVDCFCRRALERDAMTRAHFTGASCRCGFTGTQLVARSRAVRGEKSRFDLMSV